MIMTMSPSQLLLVCMGVSLRVESDGPAWIESTLKLNAQLPIWETQHLQTDSTAALMAYELQQISCIKCCILKKSPMAREIYQHFF